MYSICSCSCQKFVNGSSLVRVMGHAWTVGFTIVLCIRRDCMFSEFFMNHATVTFVWVLLCWANWKRNNAISDMTRNIRLNVETWEWLHILYTVWRWWHNAEQCGKTGVYFLSLKVLACYNFGTTLCLRKKQDTELLPITSPNVNQFSKFFHW